ncbi:MAG: Rrf2 family transcriptional regulator [Anaerolineaceae bacterium]|nr:Rrf2 family transcriptional regulator [Anaerolineaceae bacterium]
MRLSKRGEYGLRAMIRMAEFCTRDGEPHLIQIKEISKIENISVKYLEQILLALKNAGLLNSKMGVGGGYYLARPPEEIMLGQIVRTLDGPLAPIRCVSQMAYEPCDCPDERTCGLRMAMGDVRDAIANILDNTSLENVHSRVAVVRASGLEARIRKGKSQ